MKKLLSFLLVAILIMSSVPFAVGASSADEEIVFTYKSTKIDEIESNNGKVIVDVYMTVKSDVARFWGFNIALSYNKGLTLTNVVFGDLLPGFLSTPLNIANADCLVGLSQDNSYGADVTIVKGEYFIATLTFDVDDTFNDKELQIFFDTDSAGKVSRMGDYENNLTVEFIPVKQTKVINYGDTNGDGSVNGRDYGLLLQSLNGWDVKIDKDAADTNGDGNVNGRDYGLLLQYLNGWDVTLGPKEEN